ncbi:hypothetical protein ACJVQT_23075 [Enterobacter huaxiensis]|uniref:hypothetical protein n=1 Tax=Enterobacter huaxiensis TaxID=2494702 RepID=UPI002175DE16|nr:hypothetical protein [Enterobacter huaxiensis]MCS5452550.1 hypothetical protein [Enterobacter huaxiensis]
MSVSYNLVQIVKETFGVDEVKAKAFAEAVASEHASRTATKEDLEPLKKDISDIKVTLSEHSAHFKWMTRGITFLCATVIAMAVKYFFHF